MQIAQEIDAIEIVPNHEIMAQEQAFNLSEIILEEETHDNHSKGLAAMTVEPSFQIPIIQVTVDHEEEIKEFQNLNHVINASDQFAPSSSTGHGVHTAAHMGNYGTYGSVTMEKSFRDCSISSGVGGSITHKFGWVGIDPYTSSSYSLFGNKKEEEEDDDNDHDHEEEEENEESGDHIETLPLFPMHGEDYNFNTTFCNIKPDPSSYYSGRYGSSNDGHGSSRASLELSLNSYTSWSSGPM
ncbi:hypothetical protein EZV62_014358 [Acer yangbiense]|uniref:Uncharacterized protein n=1 Tax=Acer yangbiense TaxID=1000413 RepID=A0A5C7HSF4_9ROSI|nr:hypothetical protein EZV62_014358 [Acer yangbiense]